MTTYVALFAKGKDKPVTAIKEFHENNLLRYLKIACPEREYYTKPITEEEANKIKTERKNEDISISPWFKLKQQ